jgi:hypothetical protein
LKIFFAKGKFVAHSQYEDREVLRSKGFIWDAELKRWYTEDYRAAESLIKCCDQSAIYQIGWSKEGDQKKIEASNKTEGTLSLLHPPNMVPYPFQVAGVEYILPRNACLLGDDMGLGKSAQTLLTINMRQDANSVLVVCPSILKYNWLREMRQWLVGNILVYVYEPKKIRFYKGTNTPHKKNTVLHIINYDILEKFYQRLVDAKFNYAIFDECFTYDSKVLTERGYLRIGDIVESGLPVKVLSRNHDTNKYEWKKVVRYLKHKRKSKLLKFTHKFGTFVCTPNHKIYTIEDGYVKAEEIYKKNKKYHLFVVRGNIEENSEGKVNCKILQSRLRESLEDESTAHQRENRKISLVQNSEGESENELRKLPRRLFREISQVTRKKEKEILLGTLCGGVEKQLASYKGATQKNGKIGIAGKNRKEISSLGGVDEEAQPNVQSRIRGENEKEFSWKDIFIARGKFKDNSTSTKTSGRIGVAERKPGISYRNETCEIFIPVTSNLLQGRYSDSREEVSDRSGRGKSQDEKMEISGQEKDGSFEFVGVDNIEILEPGNNGGCGEGGGNHPFVFDLEVEDNHNYFVSDTLVSNCHYVKNSQTKRTQISMRLAAFAKYKLFVTGTPIYNKPKDLFSVLNAIDPKVFGNFIVFANRYCNPKKIKMGNKVFYSYDGSSNLDELNKILRANYMVRRLKKDVLKDLPEKIKDVIILNEESLKPLVEKEKMMVTNFKAERDKLKADIEKLKASGGAADVETVYKSRVRKLNEDRIRSIGEIAKIRHELALKKVPYVVQFVTELLEGSEDGNKICLFAHHKDVIAKLNEALKKYNPVVITGETKDADRQRNIHIFQNTNQSRVFIGSMQATGVGITLTAASTVVFAELDWTPAVVEQSTDRTHRIGQKNTVWVYHIVADGSLDGKIAKMLVEKQEVASRILDMDGGKMFDKAIDS